MVVHQDKGGSTKIECAFDYRSGIDRRVINGAVLVPFKPDQNVFSVEEEHVEFFNLTVSDLSAVITNQVVEYINEELSPKFGDSHWFQAAAVWDREDAGLTATSIPSVNLTP